MPFVSDFVTILLSKLYLKGSMEKSLKRNRRRTIHIMVLMFWAYIKACRLLRALLLREIRKPKSWIMFQSDGIWLQIIHSALWISKYSNSFWTDFILLSSISHYATTSTEESVYIIGGYTGDSSTGRRTPIIAEYKNDQWYNVGSLKQSRHAHGAITSGSLTMVIGGRSSDSQPYVEKS